MRSGGVFFSAYIGDVKKTERIVNTQPDSISSTQDVKAKAFFILFPFKKVFTCIAAFFYTGVRVLNLILSKPGHNYQDSTQEVI